MITDKTVSFMVRADEVRRLLGFSVKGFSSELGIPHPTYKGWESGVRRLIASSFLRAVLDSSITNPYFSYILSGSAAGLPAQITMQGTEGFQGARLMMVRKHLGLSRQKVADTIDGLPLTTLKNYELLSRLRVPCRLYERLLTHSGFAPYIVYILGGHKACLLPQKDIKHPANAGVL